MGNEQGVFDNFLIYEGLGKKGAGLVFLRVGCPMHIYIYIYQWDKNWGYVVEQVQIV